MIEKLDAILRQDTTSTNAREHLELVREWLKIFIPIGAGLGVIAGALGIAATSAGAVLWVVLPLLVAFVFAAVLGLVAISTLDRVRYALEQRLYQWEQNQVAAREVLKITATQTTNVQVRGRSNVVSVNSTGQAVESVRLVPTHTARPTRFIDGVAEQDLLFFIERALIAGHAKRIWLGQELPSGKLVSTFEDYNQLIAPLLKAGVIVGRGERSAGKFATDDAQEIKGRLGLASGPTNQNQIAQVIEGEAQKVE